MKDCTQVDLNVTRVARRIEESMDIALVRAGHSIDLVFAPVDLIEMTQQRADFSSGARPIDARTIRVSATVDRLTGFWDANQMDRVIDNLLSNAVGSARMAARSRFCSTARRRPKEVGRASP